MSTVETRHIQGGARAKIGGNFQTKKALKDAVKARAKDVKLYSTSNMGPQFFGSASELSEDTEFLVVGPDPYNKRDWYATIKRGRNGNLVVS